MMVKKADVTRIKPEKTWVGRGGGGREEGRARPQKKNWSFRSFSISALFQN